METALVDGVTLEYDVTGTGEPVLLLHGALIADAFQPLLAEPSLTRRYQLITCHRRGYMGSSRTPGPVSVARQAADCVGLLRHLGVERAHVVGHSYGGSIALQLTLDAADVVHSLALLEPALFVGATAPSYLDALARGQQRFREGSAAVVVDEFLQARSGAAYRAALDRIVPGAFPQAVADAATWFEHELPGLLDWSFGEPEARRITQPVLAILGSKSNALWPRFGEAHRLLLTWLPHAEGCVVADGTHFMQVENPRGVARALSDFFSRHALKA